MSFEIVPSVPDRLPDMARVMSIALKRPVSLPRLKRKFLIGGDAGQGYGFLLLDKGEPVGVAASIPYRFVAPDGEVVTGAQYCDFGLLPNYRGTGVFRDLCDRLHDDTRERGTAFSYAFTSEGSRAAMERFLDHTTHGKLCSFDITLSGKAGFLARLTDRACRTVGWRGASCDIAPAPRRPSGHTYAERGADFVQARRNAGLLFQRINGHAVMLRPGAVTIAALPENLDPTEIEPLLQALGHRARRAGTRTLRLMLAPDDPAYPVVDRIAGPSPGNLQPCVHIWDKRLAIESICFGFADYENF